MAFDTKVHLRDPKSGRVIRKQPYRLHVSKDGWKYERDGIFYTPDGAVIEDRNTKAEIKHIASAPVIIPAPVIVPAPMPQPTVIAATKETVYDFAEEPKYEPSPTATSF